AQDEIQDRNCARSARSARNGSHVASYRLRARSLTVWASRPKPADLIAPAKAPRVAMPPPCRRATCEIATVHIEHGGLPSSIGTSTCSRHRGRFLSLAVLPQQDVVPLRLQFGSRARSHFVAVDELLSYLPR